MVKPSFIVRLADVEDGPRTMTWTIDQAWLRWALDGTGATPAESAGKLGLEVEKNGRRLLVRGRADVTVAMPCSRTLDPMDVELHTELFLMLDPAPEPGPSARAHGSARNKRGSSRTKKERRGWVDTPMLSDGDAASDTYSGDQVALDGFVREFILLDLPMSPVRSDLPSTPEPATGSPSPAEQPKQQAIDPRLAPLMAIANRLRDSKSQGHKKE